MTILLWVLLIVLALLAVSGGGFKVAKPEDVAKQVPSVPAGVWRLVGLFEVAAGLLLVIPLAIGWRPHLGHFAAAGLAIETLILSFLYASRSRKLVAANPLTWSLLMLALASLAAWATYHAPH